MRAFEKFGWLLLLLTLVGCAAKQPVLVFESPSLGDGGRLLRDLYRSFWLPPGSDEEIVRVGLVTEAKQVRFRARHAMRIRAMSENASWEVASPSGVEWEVTPLSITRPVHLRYYASVDHRLRKSGTILDREAAARWRLRGFPAARWVGPPSMDTEIKPHLLERWFLSLTPPTTEALARQACAQARRHQSFCKVMARAELPQVGRGKLRAVQGNFSKEFDGLLELISPRGPVEILDLVPEEIRDEISHERFGPQLYIVPVSKQEITLVQSTSFGNYLEGVVPAETFPGAPEEALKAQAVIARTYALGDAHPEFSQRPYLLCATTKCQVYRGIDFKQSTTSEAVRLTQGLILLDQHGEFVETFYHSICGGHTEPRTFAWGGTNKPYQQGVSDQLPDLPFLPLRQTSDVETYLQAPPTSYCGVARMTKADRWRWERKLERKDLERMRAQLKLSGPIEEVSVLRRGISGRASVLSVRAGGQTRRVEGEYRIRLFLGGLLSSLFTLVPENAGAELTSLTVLGGGYGHGVGLCQMGAIGRAEQGQSFAEILGVYYPGTSISPITQLGVH